MLAEPDTLKPAGAGPAERREHRQRTVAASRRELVLAAAREAFAERGLEGASLREIAKRAGYTPGAIYSYFDSKEAVYAALLGESLERLNRCVAEAPPATAAPRRGAARRRAAAEAELRCRAGAFFAFYRDHPRDLDLGFYLFNGLQPRGLTPALNDSLNARLRDALAPAYQALVALGCSDEAALAEVTALFAHAVGLLLLGHTGRIRMFRQVPDELFGRYLDALLARTAAGARRGRR